MKKETSANCPLPINVEFKKGKYWVDGREATKRETEGIEWLIKRHMDGMRYGAMKRTLNRSK